jgi:asparagine synthetase A
MDVPNVEPFWEKMRWKWKVSDIAGELALTFGGGLGEKSIVLLLVRLFAGDH